MSQIPVQGENDYLEWIFSWNVLTSTSNSLLFNIDPKQIDQLIDHQIYRRTFDQDFSMFCFWRHPHRERTEMRDNKEQLTWWQTVAFRMNSEVSLHNDIVISSFKRFSFEHPHKVIAHWELLLSKQVCSCNWSKFSKNLGIIDYQYPRKVDGIAVPNRIQGMLWLVSLLMRNIRKFTVVGCQMGKSKDIPRPKPWNKTKKQLI